LCSRACSWTPIKQHPNLRNYNAKPIGSCEARDVAWLHALGRNRRQRALRKLWREKGD
jgi:hypothetical protein